jgi:hypothetical protein
MGTPATPSQAERDECGPRAFDRARRFFSRGVEGSRIAYDAPDNPKLEALIRMEVACQLALESLPELPPETESRLREPIQVLCHVTRTEIARLKPASG